MITNENSAEEQRIQELIGSFGKSTLRALVQMAIRGFPSQTEVALGEKRSFRVRIVGKTGDRIHCIVSRGMRSIPITVFTSPPKP